MKKLIILLFVLLLYSCNNEKIESNEININKFSTESFTGSNVALLEKGEIKLIVSHNDLLNSFNSYSKEVSLGKTAISFQVEKIDGLYYIRFQNSDKSVSTVALLNNSDTNRNDNFMQVGKTVCTTTTCASCCGCIPSGDYCTLCEPLISDCKRTTTGD